MANILGQLLVELGINTAAWKSGIDKSTHDAKVFAADVKDSFKSLGGAIQELGSQFGGIGGPLTNALGSIQGIMGPLVGSMGTAAGAAAGIGAGFALAGVAALGAAVKFSATAARIGELSEITGIATESISLMADIAATKGIGVDQMAKMLERMEKSALAAAQAGPKTANAYKDLGIAVVDAQGNMREAQDIFNDVAAKFASMPDGPMRTAEAIKIFGRSGAEAIPMLVTMGTRGRELGEHFKALNDVISGPTAKASIQLKENMSLMGASFEGIENQLTADLVPALNVVAKSFVDFFEHNQSEIKSFADGLAEVAKVVLNIFQILGLVFSLIFRAFTTAVDELQIFGSTVGKVYEDIKARKFGSIWDDVKAGAKTASSEFKYNWNEAVKSVTDTMGNMLKVSDAALPEEKKGGKKPGTSATPHPDLTFIDKVVDQLAQQASKEEELANATAKVAGATIEAKAAAEARVAIEKIQDEAIQKGIQNTDAFKSALSAATEKIKEAATWSATFQAVISSQDAFNKFNDNLKKQLTSITEQSTALTAADREFAKQDATLTPLRDNVAALEAQYKKLAATHDVNSAHMQALAKDLENQRAELAAAAEGVKQYDAAWVKAQFSKELEKINAQTNALRIENEALVSGNPYGKMEAALENYIATNKIAVAEANALRAALKAQEAETAKGAALKTAQGLGFDPAKMKEYNDQIAALKDLWKAGQIPEQEYELTLAKIVAEQADLAAKTGGAMAGAKAAFADFNASTETLGQTMQKTIGAGLKGITDNFASMVATGKASWGSLIQSMEEMLLKSAIQTILNSLLKSISKAFGGGEDGGGGGGFLGAIGGLFGGGKAVGGDVTPGKSYLVGENGPELFSPGAAGTITPNGAMGGQQINQQFNITTPNADSFARSQRQISSQMYRDAAFAHQRLRQ